jgi:hypothetical protein
MPARAPGRALVYFPHLWVEGFGLGIVGHGSVLDSGVVARPCGFWCGDGMTLDMGWRVAYQPVLLTHVNAACWVSHLCLGTPAASHGALVVALQALGTFASEVG